MVDKLIIIINQNFVTSVMHTDAANKQVTLKNCVPFTDCISEINNEKDLAFVMPMYNLIEYSDNYAKIMLQIFLRHTANLIFFTFS